MRHEADQLYLILYSVITDGKDLFNAGNSNVRFTYIYKLGIHNDGVVIYDKKQHWLSQIDLIHTIII